MSNDPIQINPGHLIPDPKRPKVVTHFRNIRVSNILQINPKEHSIKPGPWPTQPGQRMAHGDRSSHLSAARPQLQQYHPSSNLVE